jgi:predicted acylesterase/phospholipase RssA
MSDTNGAKHAVILSGGGANGAYEVGVLKALFAGKSSATTREPLDPDIFVGTSVGAYNAAFLVSGWNDYGTAVIASLEQTWLDYISSSRESPDNGVFRIRDDPREFLNPVSFILDPLQPFNHLIGDSAALAWNGLQRVVNLVSAQERPLLERVVELFDFTSFVSLEPFRQTLNDTIVFDKIRDSSKQLMIIATHWNMGNVRIYNNHDMTDQLGPLIILGSSAIPGIFPPVAIGSQSFVDGGVLLNSPLTPAADTGANVLHVISLFPEVEKIPLATMSNTLATVYRQQVIAWAKILEVDIRRADYVNGALRIVALASEAIQTLGGRTPDEGLRRDLHLEEIEQYLQQYLQEYIPLTVHRYHPGDDISRGVGLLNFDRDRIKGLIERGFDDTVGHDCKRNKCVMP